MSRTTSPQNEASPPPSSSDGGVEPTPTTGDGSQIGVPALVLALLGVGAAVVLSLAVGSTMLSPVRVWHGLLGDAGDQQAIDIVRGARVPRTVLGLVVGVALGLAGCVMQALTRNPLADPGILGVNAGAAAAVVSGIAFFGLTSPNQYIWPALLGAAVVTGLVYLIGGAGRGGASPVRMTLVGTAVTASLSAYVTGLMLLDPMTFARYRFWEIGALAGRDLSALGIVAALLIVGIVTVLALAPGLNVLALGEETALALGSRTGRVRLTGALAAALLCGCATAAAGPIGFVGLAVPHLARALVGVDHRLLLPMSGLLGAIVLVLTDTAGRVVVWPQEVGVGIVTAVLGAPVLIWFVRRGRVSRL